LEAVFFLKRRIASFASDEIGMGRKAGRCDDESR